MVSILNNAVCQKGIFRKVFLCSDLILLVLKNYTDLLILHITPYCWLV